MMAHQDATITVGRPHVVLLGAGASKAAFPSGDANGRRLPLMCELIDTVEGLSELLQAEPAEFKNNIETAYAAMAQRGTPWPLRAKAERLIADYFQCLRLPLEPTIYDHMLIGMRAKDVIATFNWDPLLFLAASRVSHLIGEEYMPAVVFLHGSVAIGYCDASTHDRICIGPRDGICLHCRSDYQATPLLYPISNKDYEADPAIAVAWRVLRHAISEAYLFTIFGYSAPESDRSAVSLLKAAWGDRGRRNLEQVEIIDVLPEEELHRRWHHFIHTHHYQVRSSFYDSYIARQPRRSCDAFWDQLMDFKTRKDCHSLMELSWSELSIRVKDLLKVESAQL